MIERLTFEKEIQDLGLELEPPESSEKFAEEEALYVEAEREASQQFKVVFPSGESLRVLTGLPEGKQQDYWDPAGSGNPLLDTGPAHKDKKLSANFTVRELTTSGGVSADVARIDPKLVECLQQLRDYIGKGIKIVSGYRSWKRNKEVYAGRKPTLSQHCGGRAADIKVTGMNGLEIGKAAIDACGPNIGIGLANTFAHIDVRGFAVTWNYGGVKDSWVAEIKRYQQAKGSIRTPPMAKSKPSQHSVVAGPSTPTSFTGGNIWTFSAKTLPIQIAVFCPKAASSSSDVEVLVYAHGLLNPCPPKSRGPADLITKAPFELGKIVDASSRRIILVVPSMDWEKTGKEHPLGDPAKLNRVVDEVLNEVGRVRGTLAPSLRGLILAGHSRAYDFLNPLAAQAARANAEMSKGALAKLSQVWAFDTTYTCPIPNWRAWLVSNPKLIFNVFYKEKSKTKKCGEQFGNLVRGSAGRFNVNVVEESHCAVPVKRLPDLLTSSVPSRETQLSEREFRGPNLTRNYEHPVLDSPADEKFSLTEWKLATGKIVVARAGDKKKGTSVAITEAPAVFLPEIIGMARDMAIKGKKNALVDKLDPATWFKKFTRITFLGRPMKKDYLFSWEKIPGKDSEKLIKFLRQNFNVNWIKSKNIQKSNDRKTINISNGDNSLSLKLDDKITNVNLKFDDGRTDEFIATTMNGKLNIYKGQYLHLEMAKLLKVIESEMVKKYSGDAKKVGDMLLNKSNEGITGSRLVSSTATFSMHMFGLAVDVNYLGNPYIETYDIEALNNVLKKAALLMNKPTLVYKKEDRKNKFDRVQQIDAMLEKYFSLLDAPAELERLVQASSSSEWRGLSGAKARKKIQENLDNLAGLLARGNNKDYFKKHGILDFDKRFVLKMEESGLDWGGHYGDMMHFDMRTTGVGIYIQEARSEYADKVKGLAQRLFKEKKYGTHSPTTA